MARVELLVLLRLQLHVANEKGREGVDLGGSMNGAGLRGSWDKAGTRGRLGTKVGTVVAFLARFRVVTSRLVEIVFL